MGGRALHDVGSDAHLMLRRRSTSTDGGGQAKVLLPSGRQTSDSHKHNYACNDHVGAVKFRVFQLDHSADVLPRVILQQLVVELSIFNNHSLELRESGINNGWIHYAGNDYDRRYEDCYGGTDTGYWKFHCWVK